MTCRRLIDIPRLGASETGAAAVEFALVLPAFMALTVGAILTAQLLYETSSLHYAAEAAARCASVDTATCASNAATQTYAAGKYLGPSSPAPAFVASSAACGHQVTGSATYVLNTGVASLTIPLSATACFP